MQISGFNGLAQALDFGFGGGVFRLVPVNCGKKMKGSIEITLGGRVETVSFFFEGASQVPAQGLHKLFADKLLVYVHGNALVDDRRNRGGPQDGASH